ncbi:MULTISPECIES: hypothetical protein [unclassified Massilia]|uniref:hypothetical protein n=1 Tax=unclassified Massilia TaxID=2609279 RepID=UPI000A696D32|nr:MULTISPECIES: hypothetical protein [unclassified Massilia]
MTSRLALVLLASAAALYAIGMQSGLDVGLAWMTLISAMFIELTLWKRGLDRVRAAVAARRARKQQR